MHYQLLLQKHIPASYRHQSTGRFAPLSGRSRLPTLAPACEKAARPVTRSRQGEGRGWWTGSRCLGPTVCRCARSYAVGEYSHLNDNAGVPATGTPPLMTAVPRSGELYSRSLQRKTTSFTTSSTKPHSTSSTEFGITGYYDTGLLPDAGSQDTIYPVISCITRFCAIYM